MEKLSCDAAAPRTTSFRPKQVVSVNPLRVLATTGTLHERHLSRRIRQPTNAPRAPTSLLLTSTTSTIQHLSFNLHLTQILITSPHIHHNVKMVKDLHKQYRQLEALGYRPAPPPSIAAGAAADRASFVPHRFGGPITVFSSASTSSQPPSVPDPSQNLKTWDDTDWDTPLVPPTRAYVREPYYK